MGHNDEDKVVAQSPVRASGLSEVQLANMGKGLAQSSRGFAKDKGRRFRRRRDED